MENSWWYRGRAAVVRAVLDRIDSPDGQRILDFGAGYGGMHDELARRGEVYAFEPDVEAQSQAKKKNYRAIYDSERAALGRRYDLIGLFDVLEHIEDDRAFLERAHDALEENGKLIITVPAMPFLWSVHDVMHHHFRRYTRETLRHALIRAGYTVEYLSHWNAALFVPAALTRLLGRSGESSFMLPRFLDTIFHTLIRTESALMRLTPLPFGISLVALARKG